MTFYIPRAICTQELIIISRPIRKSLLIHEVNYSKSGINDKLGWQQEKDQPVLLQNVRIEPKERILQASNGETVNSTTILFWDAQHSTNCVFELNALIEWRGKELLIKKIDEHWDDSKLHHIELSLL